MMSCHGKALREITLLLQNSCVSIFQRTIFEAIIMKAAKANLRKVDTSVSHERVSISLQYITKDIDYRLERFKNDRQEFLS